MAAIFTFGISLILVTAILIYQNRQIKLGRVQMITTDDPLDFFGFKNELSNWLSDLSRSFVTGILKVFIKISFFLKEQRESNKNRFQVVKEKINRFIEKEKSVGPVSDFLQTVGEYKAKIKKIKKEIEEEKINK
ncbi:hypothetical protein A2645_00055 [Candidatus Nomurabacteria bacterium RIFCSPHIGHO2_01_FULL_39_9]|uniref:Uncharacterized protein n=1 Tax=Candidatus Nomurabacteria bacterium RIFCSPHIGHO2_01_FULL_39_9 TaxID=1801735 RepID=A0A1F6UVR5_9BACT|nr:MAG: hypothetical protein A2645_00055 [Candidatus Nomurabacteria bacterium RIFCSPHIGHO2_01_FULL_39_9]